MGRDCDLLYTGINVGEAVRKQTRLGDSDKCYFYRTLAKLVADPRFPRLELRGEGAPTLQFVIHCYFVHRHLNNIDTTRLIL